MVYKLNESLFDDLPKPVFKDRYNDGLEWYRIDYEYSPEYGKSYDRETWVRAKSVKDAEQKFFEKHNDDCYISEIMDKDSALDTHYEIESINDEPLEEGINKDKLLDKLYSKFARQKYDRTWGRPIGYDKRTTKGIDSLVNQILDSSGNLDENKLNALLDKLNKTYEKQQDEYRSWYNSNLGGSKYGYASDAQHRMNQKMSDKLNKVFDQIRMLEYIKEIVQEFDENMFDEDPEQLKRLTKKMNESLDLNEDGTLKNYAIELETGEIKVIKAKSMDDAANKVMNEYNIPLWAFGVCGIVNDDFAATCSKFESVDTSDLQTIATQKKQASELTDMLKEVEGDNNMVIKESYDNSLYVDIDELIGTLGRALEEGMDHNPDVFSEVADVYGRLVEMRDAGYQLNTVQSESLKEAMADEDTKELTDDEIWDLRDQLKTSSTLSDNELLNIFYQIKNADESAASWALGELASNPNISADLLLQLIDIYDKGLEGEYSYYAGNTLEHIAKNPNATAEVLDKIYKNPKAGYFIYTVLLELSDKLSDSTKNSLISWLIDSIKKKKSYISRGELNKLKRLFRKVTGHKFDDENIDVDPLINNTDYYDYSGVLDAYNEDGDDWVLLDVPAIKDVYGIDPMRNPGAISMIDEEENGYLGYKLREAPGVKHVRKLDNNHNVYKINNKYTVIDSNNSDGGPFQGIGYLIFLTKDAPAIMKFLMSGGTVTENLRSLHLSQ